MEQPRSHVLNQSQRLYSVVVRLSCVPTKQITRRETVETGEYEVLGQCKELFAGPKWGTHRCANSSTVPCLQLKLWGPLAVNIFCQFLAVK